ncbi:MAG: DHH family phosphoesterase [Candidatus Hodarchaeales archaeon]|jgi:nanoRNase/pAp phosphatase (c-di-AMP/oligoRNAs hydrolase)
MLRPLRGFKSENVINDLRSLLNKIHNEYFLITSHKNVDPDGLGGALVVYELLANLKPNAVKEIIIPTQNKITQKIIEKLNLSELIQKKPSKHIDFDKTILIIIDTNNWELVETSSWLTTENSNILEKLRTIIIFDHHQEQEGRLNADIKIIEPNFSSSIEVALEISIQFGIKEWSLQTIRAAIFGILTDTKRMALADGITLKRLGELLTLTEDGMDFYWNILDQPKSLSLRIALLKACQRIQIERIQNWIIVFSNISSFEAAAARHLNILGADISAVFCQNKIETRISFRSLTNFHKNTGINCGKLAISLSKEFNGSGSGHSTAAGCNLPAGIQIDLVREKIVHLLKSLLVPSSE